MIAFRNSIVFVVKITNKNVDQVTLIKESEVNYDLYSHINLIITIFILNAKKQICEYSLASSQIQIKSL